MRAVPNELIDGSMLMRLDAEFKRTGTCPTGIESVLDSWKSGRILMAGVFETQEVFDHRLEHGDWHLKTFVKPGAPWSIFYAVVILRADGSPDVGWIRSFCSGPRRRSRSRALDQSCTGPRRERHVVRRNLGVIGPPRHATSGAERALRVEQSGLCV